MADEDRSDVLQRGRSLLYVAATRARDELAVMYSGEPSALLPWVGQLSLWGGQGSVHVAHDESGSSSVDGLQQCG